ncbi:MAG: helix-turn-helix transcriptional regulator [Deltaproteobacteria bacterium]|nr:helix-turn-helix transcriptional regulator [Deltaproteobacteria bacterium]
MEQSIDAISNNLRSIRGDRTLSFDQLSELTGVSKSMLRQIETGKSSPTIATIWKIANGLKVSFTALLKNPVVEAEVRSFREEKPLTAESEHYRVFPLVPFEPQQSFETYYIEIDPDTVFYPWRAKRLILMKTSF